MSEVKNVPISSTPSKQDNSMHRYVKNAFNLLTLLSVLGTPSCGPKQSPAHQEQLEASSLSATEPAAQLRGSAAFNNIIFYRLGYNGNTQDSFDISMTISDTPALALAGLLGSWSGHGAANRYVNGKPNAVNLLLLRLAFSNLADQIIVSCEIDSSALIGLTLNEYARSTICPLLKSELPLDQESLDQLWQLIMGWDENESELNIWKQQVETWTKENMTRRDVLKRSLEALMLNPIFLLVSN